MSLKEGATKRREEMRRRVSWYSKAERRGSGVKKVPTEGTRSFNLEGPRWCVRWSVMRDSTSDMI